MEDGGRNLRLTSHRSRQNTYFAANCMIRGPPVVVVILPKFALPTVVFGFPKWTLLNTLNISMRASTCLPSPTPKFRDKARSTFQNPGPRRNPFGVLPQRPGVFGANVALDSGRSESPLQGRTAVWLQRHDRFVGQAERFTASAAQRDVNLRTSGDRLHCERLEPGGNLVGGERGLFSASRQAGRSPRTRTAAAT